jgi:hypothetical protein
MTRETTATTRYAVVRRPPTERLWPLMHGEPPLAAHLVSERFGYKHHGIYVGAGRVVHYSGFAYGLRAGPVEETSLERFACGRPLSVFHHARPRFDRAEVIARARARIGENAYRLLSNNCEHLCRWCVLGEARSSQVEKWLALPRRVWLSILERSHPIVRVLRGRVGSSRRLTAPG